MPSVPRAWVGDTAVCLAGGPSLTAEDVGYVRGKARVIAVNDAYRLAPWADVLYAGDYKWWSAHKDQAEHFPLVKYSIQHGPYLTKKLTPLAEAQQIQVLKNTGVEGLELKPTGLRTGQNSGYQAINLAVHFGVTRILLLGYDLQATGGRAHWFGDHPPGLQMPASLFDDYRKWFDTLIEPLREAGVEVINCSPETSLRCFPRAALRSVLVERAA